MVVALRLPQSAFLSSPLREPSHGEMELWQVRQGLQVFTHTLGPEPKSNKMDIATVQQPKRKIYKELGEEKKLNRAQLSWIENSRIKLIRTILFS